MLRRAAFALADGPLLLARARPDGATVLLAAAGRDGGDADDGLAPTASLPSSSEKSNASVFDSEDLLRERAAGFLGGAFLAAVLREPPFRLLGAGDGSSSDSLMENESISLGLDAAAAFGPREVWPVGLDFGAARLARLPALPRLGAVLVVAGDSSSTSVLSLSSSSLIGAGAGAGAALRGARLPAALCPPLAATVALLPPRLVFCCLGGEALCASSSLWCDIGDADMSTGPSAGDSDPSGCRGRPPRPLLAVDVRVPVPELLCRDEPLLRPFEPAELALWRAGLGGLGRESFSWSDKRETAVGLTGEKESLNSGSGDNSVRFSRAALPGRDAMDLAALPVRATIVLEAGVDSSSVGEGTRRLSRLGRGRRGAAAAEDRRAKSEDGRYSLPG